MPDTLTTLRALHESATPGPWTVEEADDGYWDLSVRGDGETTALYAHVTTIPIEADAELIAAARNALPALLVVAEAAQRCRDLTATTQPGLEALDALRAALDDLEGTK